ncbi:class I SAM-dependent methyltransferase [Marinobacterium arenosum]|uniref:class I SAM-dependent methyltransferase n=1 Tax=Marinobacterium arenosum TaxID=2862496 RepID=UPI001C9784A4|nr:methyltransferase domain-containing protein [Marinobacterium arenosum]MBY4677256.1 class I SAM-dependent methyltransferase [Marinobacterium arenosum]
MAFRSQPSLEVLLPELRHWFDSELGQELLAAEREQIDRVLANLHGMHLLQISVDNRLTLFDQSPVHHPFMLCSELALGAGTNVLVGDHHDLPLQSDVVDVVLLHHVLDFATSPHQVLREAARVLRPGGHLLVIGFNPVSYWGLYRLLRRKDRERVPWRGHFISHRRLQDWLALLELTELKSWSGYFWLPFASAIWRRRSRLMAGWSKRSPARTGAFLMMLARKDVAGMTPITPVWRRRLIRLPLAEPTARGHTRECR